MLAALALFALALPAQAPRVLSSEELQADVFQLTDTLSRLHAGLHRYASAEEIDEAFGALALTVEDEPHDVLWFHRQVSALIARIGCGHSRVILGERDRAAALARRGMLPFTVLLDGERAWLLKVLEPKSGLRPGQELLALDGLSMAELRARAFARMSDDGFVTSAKERGLEHEFAESYAVLVDETPGGPFELRLAGVAEPVHVAGLAPEAYRAARGPEPERPLVSLQLLPADDAARLSIAAFGSPPAGEPGFLAQLETSFRTLREKQVAHLILDLRGNGGGVDTFGAALVSYLARAPFGYFERIEVTPDYQGDVEIVEREGRRLMLSHPGLQVQQPAELHFLGEVSFLIDGDTFSTAADVASVAHANHLATFLGEETGGGYEGNNSGDSMRLALRSSGITVNVPEWNYTTAGVAPGHHGRGVEPEVALKPTIADALSGRDAVLERALERIRAGTKR